MKRLLAVLLTYTAIGGGFAAEYVTDGSLADVQAKVNASVAGDTVIIPSGTFTWTDVLVINKPIWLRGQTVITGAGTSTPSSDAATVIIDSLAGTGTSPNKSRTNSSMIVLYHQTASGVARISNLEIRPAASYPDTSSGAINSSTGIIKIWGSNTANTIGNSQIVVGNVKFAAVKGRAVGANAWSMLIHDCWFDQAATTSGEVVAQGNITGGVTQGHTSWAAATSSFTGTADEGVFIEDCTAESTVASNLTDAFSGGRLVVRYCYLKNIALENHGIDTSNVQRGGRWIASYNNTFVRTVSSTNPYHLFRSGTGVLYNNTLSGTAAPLARFVAYRLTDDWSPYEGASGTNPFDKNYETLYASGTHNGAAGAANLVDTTANWEDGEWIGYQVINTTDSTATAQRYSHITANTTTSISGITATVVSSNPTTKPVWDPGDAYEIRRVQYALDQPGMGQSDLLVGGSPSVRPTPVAWPNQLVEPVYMWSNTGFSASGYSTGYFTIINGEHYIDGTHPTYTAYTYPHPLQSDLPPDVTAPTITDITVYEDTLTLTFDEPVVGVSASDFSMSGGRSLSAASGGGDNWTMTVSPAAAFGAAYTLDYSGTAAEDSASNNLATFTGRSITNTTPEPPPSSSVKNPGRRAKGGRVLTR